MAEIGKPKIEFQSMELDHDLFEASERDFIWTTFKAAMDTDDKTVRDARLLPITRLNIDATKYPEQ